MSEPTSSETGSETGGILVGYDGSPAARAAVSWAAWEAWHSDRPLHVARCYEPTAEFVDLAWTPVGLPVEDWRALHVREAVQELAAHCRSEHPGLEVRTTVRAGQPREVLAALAEETDAELTVLGCADHGRLSRLLLGSTAADLVRNLDRPIVTVHTGHHAEHGGPVLLAADHDREATEFALAFAERHHCQVHVVHSGRHALVELSVHAQLLVVEGRNALHEVLHASCPVAVIPDHHEA